MPPRSMLDSVARLTPLRSASWSSEPGDPTLPLQAGGERVAVLGLGSLGSAVAERLVTVGHSVTVWNQTRRPCELDAHVADTAHAAAAGADVVIACVRDEDASRDTWLGPDGAVNGLRPGALAVELSSLPPAWLRELEPIVAARDARLVEAPVAGGPDQIRGGTAHLLVGGLGTEPSPVLGALGTRQDTGPVGTASVLKALRNALVAVELSAMAEAVAVAAAHDLDHATLLEMLERGGGPASPVLRRALAAPGPVTFTIALSLKDTRTALDLAAAAGAAAPTMAAAAALLQRMVDEGRGETAHTAVIDACSWVPS